MDDVSAPQATKNSSKSPVKRLGFLFFHSSCAWLNALSARLAPHFLARYRPLLQLLLG